MAHPRSRARALLIAAVLCAAPAAAQIVNGSFEDSPNHLNGWTLGPAARVEALQTNSFGANTIPVPDASWFVLISTGPGATPTGPSGDFDANGTTDNDSSTLTTTFSTAAAGESLSFAWAVLTDEIGPGGQGDLDFDDLFDIRVDGVSILQGSVRKPGGISPFPDTVAYDGSRYTVASPGLTDGSDFGSQGGGRTPFHDVCLTIADAGPHTLEFLVADQSDELYDSALLVDDVVVATPCNPTIQITHSTQSTLEAKGGAFVFTAVTNGRVAASDNGSIVAFRSDGDYVGNNPSLAEQIWLATRTGASYAVTPLTATVNATYDSPDLSSNGQWLAFASTADLVPPGNADGNMEIFRFERDSAVFTQVTTTTACSSGSATINDDGTRIAFVSDCDLGISAGADDEIVLWDGSGAPVFRGIDSDGCANLDPRISRDAAGRYVAFLTDCDGDYPGTSNPDSGREIVQWDTLADGYLQVTTTAAGRVNDAVSSSADGSYLSFVSDADHETGENPAGSLVAFRYDRISGSFLQLVDPSPLALFTYTDLDDSGAYVAAERIDVLAGTLDLILLDVAAPRTESLVVAGSPTVANTLPSVALSGSGPQVLYQSNGDFVGANADGNTELWVSGSTFDPPDPAFYCSTPAAPTPIPDNSAGGIDDFINVAQTGTLTDLDVIVRIDHTFVGDLRVELRHIDTGTQRRLIDRPGRPPGAGCSGDDIDATLDDEAGSSVENECVTPGPAIVGTFRPNQTLTPFDGEDISGSWRLRVSDRRNNNTGTLIEWCLVPSY